MVNYKNSVRPLIAVFDSGIGGLNLLKACACKIPQADFAYFADNFRVPYGNLSEDEIKIFAFEAFDKIAELHPVCAAVACNTVTACCIKELRARYPFPVVGMQPAVKQAAMAGGDYIVLATHATAESQSFKTLLKECGGRPHVSVCHGLAAEIEEHIFSLDDYKFNLPRLDGFSSVVLGCTHYIFIKNRIKKLCACPVFDGISGTVDHLRKISGIFDHRDDFCRKISFYGGDFNKNKAVFEQNFN